MISKIENNLPPKLNLWLFLAKQLPLELDNNPSTRLITNYKELLSLLNDNNENIMKFIYFNKRNIHKILYIFEEKINVRNKEKILFSELFYLISLIRDDLELINYSYSINFIYETNMLQRNISNNLLKKIVMSKIVIQLVKNYRESDEFKSYEESQLEMIENENKNNISDNINNNYMDLYNIKKSSNLEEDYINIIKGLITFKYKNNNDILFYKNIEDLELQSIDITKNMFDELYKLLSLENENIRNILILNEHDLNDIKKIKFYFILLKYIIKDHIYIYRIPFLLKTRENIIKIIKNGFNQLSIIVEKDIKEKIEYIIKVLTDSDYYYKKYISLIVC